MTGKRARLAMVPLLAIEPEIRGRHGLAFQLGVSWRTVQRWKVAGGVPVRDSDAAAVALGHHPAELWSGWFDDVSP